MNINDVTRWATLTREIPPNDTDGQIGDWQSDSGYQCKFGELAWRNNHPDFSCAPLGKYLVFWKWSNHHNCNLYHLMDVPGRTDLELHKGNLMGDVLQERKSDSKGCGLPGESIAIFAASTFIGQTYEQRGVSNSGIALAALEADMLENGEQSPFWLTIQ